MRIVQSKKSVSMEKNKTTVIRHISAVSRIVLNIPHSSTAFPSRKEAEAWPKAIQSQIDRWTDWITDVIFDSADPRIIPIVFPYSRFYCDVERLIDDPLESIGQGIFYERFEGLYRHWTVDARDVAMKWYHWHIDRLGEAIIAPDTLLIDCHSFPEDLSEVDICIGLNDNWSRPSRDVIKLVVSHFRQSGYRTEINTPYSNSITPPKAFWYMSLMIEVNKKIYLDECNRLNPSKGLILRQTINDLYQLLFSS